MENSIQNLHDEFSQSKVIEESNEITKLMIMLLVIPLFCQGPAVTLKVVQCFVKVNAWISRLLMFAFPSTSAFSPFLIVIMLKRYRRKVTQFFVRRFNFDASATTTVFEFHEFPNRNANI